MGTVDEAGVEGGFAAVTEEIVKTALLVAGCAGGGIGGGAGSRTTGRGGSAEEAGVTETTSVEGGFGVVEEEAEVGMAMTTVDRCGEDVLVRRSEGVHARVLMTGHGPAEGGGSTTILNVRRPVGVCPNATHRRSGVERRVGAIIPP